MSFFDLIVDVRDIAETLRFCSFSSSGNSRFYPNDDIFTLQEVFPAS